VLYSLIWRAWWRRLLFVIGFLAKITLASRS